MQVGGKHFSVESPSKVMKLAFSDEQKVKLMRRLGYLFLMNIVKLRTMEWMVMKCNR